MGRWNLGACLTVVCATALSTIGIAQLQAAGYWNVPSNLGQRTGHGFGGGYHAPWLLGPVQHDCCNWGKPTRLPYAPTPFYGCASCGQYGQMLEAPSSLDGTVPTAAPSPSTVPPAAVPTEVRRLEPAQTTVTENTSNESTMLEPQPIVVPAVEATSEPTRPLFETPVLQ